MKKLFLFHTHQHQQQASGRMSEWELKNVNAIKNAIVHKRSSLTRSYSFSNNWKYKNKKYKKNVSFDLDAHLMKNNYGYVVMQIIPKHRFFIL